MCDEARCYKEEQMALCVRYTKDLNVHEGFLGFVDWSVKQDAEALSQHIFDYFKACNLSNKAQIIGQSYDGASFMAGKFNGVQAKIQNKYPYAVYTHCMAHRINLVVVDMCKFVKETRCIFNTLESIYNNFSYPTKNQQLIVMQKKLGLKFKTIGRIIDTRWNCRYNNCDAVLDCNQAIIHDLQEENDDDNDKDVNSALGILTNLQKASFIVNLFVIRQVLSIIIS
ncbi:zinc finger MYM-type protein 1-like [Daktulosphaira vitifoliae]|uniref:zinc finger MYM-type protein 1-like n=1 Tax=Daktulosphaira vitifoliae TaxID=58002 RepID=UPI0021AA64C2|nr:zinc finger MYM-type protein 1-like [Daktulosphaira vitifoliae]